jgi:hypothetical protein
MRHDGFWQRNARRWLLLKLAMIAGRTSANYGA